MKSVLLAGTVFAGVMMAGPVPPGWSECFSQPYGTFGPDVATATAGCTGDLMMLAGGVNGSGILTVLAWAPKVDVLTVTGTDAVHNANGTDWYSNGLSMGFAPAGFGISQDSCDTNSAPGFGSVGDSGDDRLCWHRDGDLLNGGWRAGNTTFLNDEPSGYTRYIFHADSSLPPSYAPVGPQHFVDFGSSVPEPVTGVLCGLGLALGAVVSRRRRAQ